MMRSRPILRAQLKNCVTKFSDSCGRRLIVDVFSAIATRPHPMRLNFSVWLLGKIVKENMYDVICYNKRVFPLLIKTEQNKKELQLLQRFLFMQPQFYPHHKKWVSNK